jgi:chemotaxis protein methyltransferase CheR
MWKRKNRLNGPRRFELSDDEFFMLSSLIEKQIGIHFPKEKQREFQIKLEKLTVEEFDGTPKELIEAAMISDEMLGKIANMLTVGESYFFRNRPHFAALKSNILTDIISDAEERRSLNIWSAGCATGEEPYSLAILINEHFPHIKNWDINILATDINTDFLTKARVGVYRKWSLRGLEDRIIQRHFYENKEGNFTLRENIKKTVTFKRFNLTDLLIGARPMGGNIDLLLCRNVLIYFPFRTGDKIVSAMLEMIRRGGYLMVGHSESFPALGNFEVIHAHATYYYRRYLNEQTALLSMPAPETTAIPGIAVRTTYLPAPIAKVQTPVPIRVEKQQEPENTLESQITEARELADSGHNEDALKFLEELSENEGRLDHRVHFLMALIADHSGYVLRAIESLKRSIFLSKNFVVGHYYLGVIYQREGDESVAKRHFKNVLRLLSVLPIDEELEEAEGVTAGRLKEIVESIFEEIDVA